MVKVLAGEGYNIDHVGTVASVKHGEYIRQQMNGQFSKVMCNNNEPAYESEWLWQIVMARFKTSKTSGLVECSQYAGISGPKKEKEKPVNQG